MKTESKTASSSILELNLNTSKVTEHGLQPPESNYLPMLQNQVGRVPGMPGFHYAVEEHGDAALLQVAKGGLELVTAAVVWGQEALLYDWLVMYRATQLPWLPGGVWILPEISQFPWTAFMQHLGIAAISMEERRRVQQFRHRLVTAIIHEKS
jgi:hypothetical protein